VVGRVLGVLLLVVLGSVGAGEDALRLPAHPGTVVVALLEGATGGELHPTVQVLASGRVRVDGAFAPGVLTRAELEDLLRFVVEDQGFFRIDSEGIARRLADRGWPPPRCPLGESTTGIAVKLADRHAKTAQLMLDTVVERAPDLADAGLRALVAIRERLRLEARCATAGGRSRVAELCTLANERLRLRHPDLPAFTLDQFRGLVDVPEGELALSPGMDPNASEVHGRCGSFSYETGGDAKDHPRLRVTAVVRIEDRAPRAYVEVRR